MHIIHITTIIKNTRDNNYNRGCKEKRTSTPFVEIQSGLAIIENNMEVTKVIQNTNPIWPSNSYSVYNITNSKIEMKSPPHKNICTPLFTEAWMITLKVILFIIAKLLKQSKYPLVDE
jgi:hypothetical protein